jgi:hypothetical protein
MVKAFGALLALGTLLYKTLEILGTIDFLSKILGYQMDLSLPVWVVLVGTGAGALLFASDYFSPSQPILIQATSEPQIDIEYSGKPPHRDMVGGCDYFRLGARNKSKTTDARSVNLWLSEVTSISGWRHNIGEQRLRQYGDTPSEEKGFRTDAALTPDERTDYDFLSRWREDGAEIGLWLAVAGRFMLPAGQYTMTIRATASSAIPSYRKFLVGISSQNALTMEPLGPTYIKPLS